MEKLAATIEKRRKEMEADIVIEGGDILTVGGYTIVPNYILETPKLSSNSKLVYALLLRRAQNKDYSFPGQEKLGKDCGLSARTVWTCLKELEKKHCLKIQRRGQGKTNLYILTLKKLEQKLKSVKDSES